MLLLSSATKTRKTEVFQTQEDRTYKPRRERLSKKKLKNKIFGKIHKEIHNQIEKLDAIRNETQKFK